MVNKLKYIFLVLVLTPLAVLAQKDSVGSYSIVTTKEYKPVIVEGIKIGDAPFYADSTPRIPNQKYGINSKQIPVNFQLTPIQPAKMVGEPLVKLYNSMLKLGYGNYNTPYGEFFIHNLRSKKYAYGAHLKHISSSATLQDRGFAGMSNSVASVFGKRFFKKHILYGDFDYSYNTVHYYGYDATVNTIKKDFTKQYFSFINPHARFVSQHKDSSKINYDLGLNFYNLTDYYKTAENNVFVESKLKGFYDKQLISLLTSVDFYNTQQTTDTLNNTIVRISPDISFAGKKWAVSIGVTGAADAGMAKNKFYFYPRIDFNYNVFNNIIIPYVGITGDVQKNSFRSLTATNPFINPSMRLANSNKKLDVYGGFRGTVEAHTSYNIRASYSQIDSMPFFVNDDVELLNNRFKAVYDNVTLLNLHGEIAFQKTEKFRFVAKGDYFSYTMTNEARPWHMPQMRLTFGSQYNLRNKIVVRADMFVVNKRFVKLNATGSQVQELKGFADVNLGIDYNYTKLFSFFAQFNNIAGTRYYMWKNYSSQRFNFLAGLKITF